MTIQPEPFAAVSLQLHEDRSPRQKFKANPNYWDQSRGPKLAAFEFRNDLAHADALAAVCDREGEVDIVTELDPSEIPRVDSSRHAKLVHIEAIRVIAAIVNRDTERFAQADARRALSLALDRKTLVSDVWAGYAEPIAGLTPPIAVPRPLRSSVPSADPNKARTLWQSTGPEADLIRLAAPGELQRVAEHIAAQWRDALGAAVELTIYRDTELLAARRALTEKRPLPWDVYLHKVVLQASDTVAVEMHRAFVASDGEFRAGPAVPEFEALYAKLLPEPTMAAQLKITSDMEQLVMRDALAIGLYAPHALYAVNREVNFVPYRSTLELAETSVTSRHWSRR